MAMEPAMDASDELAALFRRADLAAANARLLVAENNRLRQSILSQFDYMYEIGIEFRANPRVAYPASPLDHVPKTSFSR
jgi:hypothetical protein